MLLVCFPTRDLREGNVIAYSFKPILDHIRRVEGGGRGVHVGRVVALNCYCLGFHENLQRNRFLTAGWSASIERYAVNRVQERLGLSVCYIGGSTVTLMVILTVGMFLLLI
jgi:hypothetical protein